MKKRGKIIKYLSVFLLIFGIAFLFNIPKAFAGTAHQFSFEFYDCGDVVEADLTDTVNPETNKVTKAAAVTCTGTNAKINPTNVPGVGNVIKLEKGKIVGVGIHYKPGSVTDYGMQFKYTYDGDSFEPLFFQIYNKKDKTYSPSLAYKIDEDFADYYNKWEMYPNKSTIRPDTLTFITNDSRGLDGDYLEDELNIVYTYFLVKEDATVNTALDFTFDNTPGTGVAMNNTEPVSMTNAKGYVEVPLSEDNTLGSLSVKNGSTTYTLDPAFTPGDENTTSYTAVVPNNITSVDISATAHDDPRAILSGDTGTQSNLSVGNNQFTITVLSESGTPKDYTVNVYRLSNNANLSALSLTDVDFGTFAAGTTSYTATVPYTTSSTTVSATVADTNKATLASGATGNKNLSVGSNPISVTVNAENCKSEYSSVPGNTCTNKTYTVTVTREAASDNANAATLTVDGISVPEFNKDTLVYTLDDVANNKTNVIIAATSEEEHATITGIGTRDLSVGDNALKVKITAQDGTTSKEYTINIHRKSNNANLSTLNVTSSKTGSLSPAFNPNTTSYTYNTDADETSVNIAYTKADENASVVTTPANLTGINPRTTSSVTIEVTPEDTTQTKKTYTITFAVAKSSNANLSDLTIDGTPVDGFNKDTISYNITVPTTTEGVLIDATAEDDRVKSITGNEYTALSYGLNEIPVVVTAEDGTTTKTYTLNITRTKKSDANFLDLKVDTVTVPGFDPNDADGKVYDLGEVPNNKTSILIEVTKSDTDATVSGDGSKDLVVGEQTFPVTITAQNGTDTKTYNIKIKRLNNVKDLASLTVTSDPAGTLDPAFDPSKTTYTYTTDPDETEVTISATVPAGSGATVTGTGTYNPANTSEVILTVKAEDGSEKPYVINLVRGESSNNNLSAINIDGTPLSGFDPTITSYDINVTSDTASVDIEAILADNRASVSGDGVKALNYGNNQIPITVTAENGTPKVYYLNITRALKNNANLSDLKVDTVTVPGFDPNDDSGTVYDLGEVNSDKASIVIAATKADSDASVTGDGTKTLATGVQQFPVTVTAQDGVTTKTYVIQIKKLSSDSSLTGLEIQADTQGTLSPAFDPTKTEYTYTSDPDEDEVTIVVTPAEGADAVIVGHPDGKVNPADGEDIEVIVTAEDGSNTIYTIHVERGLSSNNYLDQLEVENYDIVPDFDKDEDHYTLSVNSDIDKATIIAHAEDDRATVSGDTGEQNLAYGSNVFTVTVTAEDNTERPYYITITRALNSDVKLSDLKVEGTTIDGFDPDTPTYDYGTVENDVDSLTVIGTPQDQNATVEVIDADENGVVPIAVGDNTITIKVTAQDNTEGFYTITVTRKAESNNDLNSLEVEDYTLDPEFNKDITSYAITVPSDVDDVHVNAVPDDPTATVTVEGADNLQPGENTITVTVTADDGTPKVYTITVTKEEEDDEKITSVAYGHIIEDGMIKSVVYKSVSEDLKDQLDNDNDKLFIYDKDDAEEIAADRKLGTGMIIKLIKNGRENDRDFLVIKGDVNGDGQIKINDVVATVNQYLKSVDPVTGPYFAACDVAPSSNPDGVIKINDVVGVVNRYLGN